MDLEGNVQGPLVFLGWASAPKSQGASVGQPPAGFPGGRVCDPYGPYLSWLQHSHLGDWGLQGRVFGVGPSALKALAWRPLSGA